MRSQLTKPTIEFNSICLFGVFFSAKLMVKL